MVSSTNCKKHHQPLMIALKGSLSSKKSQIATKLASFLRYPLLDEGDIIQALSKPTTSSFTHYPKDLPFRIVTQISSTQLSLRLNVIMNSELSQPSHLDHLVHLATARGACFLILDCEATKNDALYDVGHVPKLDIDITKPFVVEEFVPAMLRAAESRQAA